MQTKPFSSSSPVYRQNQFYGSRFWRVQIYEMARFLHVEIFLLLNEDDDAVLADDVFSL